MKRIVTIILIFCWVVPNVYSQQLPIYSQYTDNIFILNPAVAGNDGLTTLNMTNRMQWLGLQDAPRTNSFSAQGRLLKGTYKLKDKFFKGQGGVKERYIGKKTGKVGLGGYIYNDKIGLLNKTGFQFSYAYHIFLKGSTELSFGLSLTTFQFKFDRDKVLAENPYDPILYSAAAKTSFVPDANAGVFLLNKSYFVGLSAMQLAQSFVRIGNNAIDYQHLRRHYYLIGGFNFYVNSDYKIIPSVLIRTTENLRSTIQSDLSVRVFYRDAVWGGISYRTNQDMVALLGVRWDRYSILYAFDYPRDPIRQHSYGSHELSISIKLGDTDRRYRWLDRY